MSKKTKKKIPAKAERVQSQMRLVTSDTCAVCTQQCRRGLNYLAKMAQPGAVGYGVPCILTLGKTIK